MVQKIHRMDGSGRKMNPNVIPRTRMSLPMSSWSDNPVGSIGESDHSGDCSNNYTGSV